MQKTISIILVVLSSVLNAGYFDSNGVTLDGIIEDGEYANNARVFDSSLLTMTGGGASIINVKDNSHLNVISTKTPLSGYYEGGGGIYDIDVTQNASLTFSGGIVESIELFHDATALLNGGEITYLECLQYDEVGKSITIDCKDGWQWLYDSKQKISGIVGEWHNGDSFSIQFIDPTFHPEIFKPTWTHVEVVPEPMSIGLLALGGLALNLRKRV